MTIRVYLLRHGPAGDRSAWRRDDADRPLTKGGAGKVKQIARALAAEGLAPDVMVTSPYARCVQTAALVAEALDRQDVMTSVSMLEPGFATSDFTGLLDSYPTAEALMLVGHEPDLSDLCTDLCGARVALRKGALVELEVDRSHPTEAVLLRLEQPVHLLRRVSRVRLLPTVHRTPDPVAVLERRAG